MGYGSLMRGFYFGYDWTYILVLIGAFISLIASARVKSSFNKYVPEIQGKPDKLKKQIYFQVQ